MKYFVVLTILLCGCNSEVLTNLSFQKGKPLTLDSPNETLLRISGLSGAIYLDSLTKLENVKQLVISNSTITEIEAGALCSNPSIKDIEFDNVKLPNITKETLKNCEQLETLMLKFQDLGFIEDDAFSGMERLSALGIYRTSLTSIKKDFLKDLKNLQVLLIIDSPNLQEIHPEAFDNLKELIWSMIEGCSITSIKGLFKNKPKLVKIKADRNKINGISAEDIEGSPTLAFLNFSDNQIKNFDLQLIDNLLNMLSLDLRNNPLNCDGFQSAAEAEQMMVNRFYLEIFSDCPH